MSVECFLDTNILVYAVSALREDATKKSRALELIQTADFGVSSQVLQEFYVTVTRKIRKPSRSRRLRWHSSRNTGSSPPPTRTTH